jgi:hypothetical protein
VQPAALVPNFIKVQSPKKKLYQIPSNSKPRDFSDFSFESHSESVEASMEKVVHLFKIFKIIFYSKFLELGKVKFRSVKVWKNLNVF